MLESPSMRMEATTPRTDAGQATDGDQLMGSHQTSPINTPVAVAPAAGQEIAAIDEYGVETVIGRRNT